MSKPVVKRARGRRGAVWTRAEALAWYDRARAKLGHRVRQSDMADYARVFRRLFGTIPRFQAAGGDEPGRRGRPRKGDA